MNKDNAKDYLPLVQALAEGRVIEQYVSTVPGGVFEWHQVHDPSWALAVECYRVRRESRKAWIWWPPHGIDRQPWATLDPEEAAQWINHDMGGHITEVTE